MNEVKKPRQPMVFYYLLAIAAIILFNSVIAPMLFSPRVAEVDYGEFMRMTQEKQIDQVMIEDNKIIFSDKTGNLYKTGMMDDPDYLNTALKNDNDLLKKIYKSSSGIKDFVP